MVQLYVIMNKKVTKLGLILSLLALFGYSFYIASGNFRDLYHRLFPCKKPILYTMQSYSDKFGISKDEFVKAIKDADSAE